MFPLVMMWLCMFAAIVLIGHRIHQDMVRKARAQSNQRIWQDYLNQGYPGVTDEWDYKSCRAEDCSQCDGPCPKPLSPDKSELAFNRAYWGCGDQPCEPCPNYGGYCNDTKYGCKPEDCVSCDNMGGYCDGLVPHSYEEMQQLELDFNDGPYAEDEPFISYYQSDIDDGAIDGRIVFGA